MHETFTSYNLANVLVNVPKYAILIIVVPMLTLTVLKLWLTARKTFPMASRRKNGTSHSSRTRKAFRYTPKPQPVRSAK